MASNDATPSEAAQNDESFSYMLHALYQPAAFPFSLEANEHVTVVQTHASAVILTPALVYKLKKPRNFGFFDYSTPALRRHFCQQEVMLNAPLAPQIYLGLAPVIRIEGDRYRFGPVVSAEDVPEVGVSLEDGVVVDYAVVMKRLPEERTLFSLLRSDEVTADLMQDVARMVAHFHQTTPTSSYIEQFGYMDMIRHNWEENFEQMRPYVGRTLSSKTYKLIERYVRLFMEQRTALFEQRLQSGCIRDCHGDLRLQHVYILPERNEITSSRFLIMDRIEFNERFRYGDTAAEISFLAMELDDANRADLAQIFIEQYVAETGDETLREVLPFYACYRACVRGKVTSFQLEDTTISQEQREQAQAEAQALFHLAASYTSAHTSPVVLMVGGLMGTGKSTLAHQIQQQLGWSIQSSDIIRKRLAHLQMTEPQNESFGKGIYNPLMTQRTYEGLASGATDLLQQSRSAILDATFLRRADRQRVANEARRYGADVVFLECVCSAETSLERLDRRWQARLQASSNTMVLPVPSVASDGRPELYDLQCEQWETFNEKEEPGIRHIVVTTTEPLSHQLEQVLTTFNAPHFLCPLSGEAERV